MGMRKITFTGDIMCKKEFVEKWETNKQFQFESMFAHVKDFLHESDYVIGNLETPLAGKNSDIHQNRSILIRLLNLGRP